MAGGTFTISNVRNSSNFGGDLDTNGFLGRRFRISHGYTHHQPPSNWYVGLYSGLYGDEANFLSQLFLGSMRSRINLWPSMERSRFAQYVYIRYGLYIKIMVLIFVSDDVSRSYL